MTTLKRIGAAALAWAAFSTPSLAQEAIAEPGLYAFYHPNGDLLGTKRPADAMAAFPRGRMVELRVAMPRTALASHRRHGTR